MHRLAAQCFIFKFPRCYLCICFLCFFSRSWHNVQTLWQYTVVLCDSIDYSCICLQHWFFSNILWIEREREIQLARITSINQNLTLGVFDCRDCRILLSIQLRLKWIPSFCSINVVKSHNVIFDLLANGINEPAELCINCGDRCRTASLKHQGFV